MMIGFQQGLIYQAVAEPFILVRMNFGKIDGLLDQCPEHIRLWKCLSVHLSDPGCGAVGGNNYQRHFLIKSLCHSRMKI